MKTCTIHFAAHVLSFCAVTKVIQARKQLMWNNEGDFFL